MNYASGDIRNGLAIVRLDQSASTYEFSVYSFAQTHLVADVVGDFREPEATALDYVTVSSAKVSGVHSLPASSPVCPVGDTIISGGCDTNGAINRSIIENNVQNCDIWSPGASTLYPTSHGGCCGTPGRS